MDRFIPSRSSLQDLDCLSSLKQESIFNTPNFPFIENKKNIQNQMTNNFERKKIKSRKGRIIPKTPFKILDAPYLQDDFYLNTVDWSLGDNLAVGLGNTSYIWNFTSTQVKQLHQYTNYNLPTHISWDLMSEKLLIGTLNGRVEIWDVCKKKIQRKIDVHTERVGAGSLFGNMLITGSRDKRIICHDLRQKNLIKIYNAHK